LVAASSVHATTNADIGSEIRVSGDFDSLDTALKVTDNSGSNTLLAVDGVGKLNVSSMQLSSSGSNGELTLATLTNTHDPASGETGDTADLVTSFHGSTDSGSSWFPHESAKIEVSKGGDWWGGDETDFSSKMTFFVMSAGAFSRGGEFSPNSSGGADFSVLGTLNSSVDGENAELNLGIFTNTHNPATGETGDTLGLLFALHGSTDSGASWITHDAAKIEAYKESDWFGANETDFDAGIKLYTTSEGTTASNYTFPPAAGSLTFSPPSYPTAGTDSATTKTVTWGILSQAFHFTHDDYAVAAHTHDELIVTLPAKTVLVSAQILITEQATFTDTLVISLGSTAATYDQIILDSDLKVSANTIYGDVDGERGADLPDANMLGFKMYSYTATQDIYAHIDGNATNLNDASATAGEFDVILTWMSLP
jgi:hypothetical protein